MKEGCRVKKHFETFLSQPSGHIFMKTCCQALIHTEENIFVHPTDFFIIEMGWLGPKKYGPQNIVGQGQSWTPLAPQ